jgi:hypothetical protein
MGSMAKVFTSSILMQAEAVDAAKALQFNHI